jgi:hypothetical protein
MERSASFEGGELFQVEVLSETVAGLWIDLSEHSSLSAALRSVAAHGASRIEKRPRCYRVRRFVLVETITVEDAPAPVAVGL